MEPKKLLRLWEKLCLRKRNTPICLVTVSADGTPNVFTHHDQETLQKVFKHLLDSGVVRQE